MTKTARPQPPEPIVLEYRSRGAVSPPWFGPVEWLKTSLLFGSTSWATVGALCVGPAAPLAWLPVALAAAGLLTGVIAAVRPLPRDYTGGVILAMFMNFSVLAIWLLALTLL